MAKRQKTFFERLSEKNEIHENKKIKKVSNSQATRKKAAIATLSLLSVGVILAIAVPLGVTTNSVTVISPVDDSSTAFTFKGPNSSDGSQKLTVGSVTKSVQGSDAQVNEEISDVTKKLVFYLYDQEYKASVEQQRVYNASLALGQSARNDIALSSLEEIKKKQTKVVEDLKRNYISVYGFQNWQKQFTETLSTDSKYSGAKDEAEAIENLTYNEIKTYAEARFKPEFVNTTRSEINKLASRDIYKVDANGNEISSNGQRQVLIKSGEKVNSFYQDGSNYFLNAANNNLATAFLTKSFVSSQKDPSEILKSYFDANDLHVVTSVDLPGKLSSPVTNAITLDADAKAKFINLAKYWSVKNTNSQRQILSGSEILKQLKPATSYFPTPTEALSQSQITVNQGNYQTFLNTLTLTKGDSYGTSGLQSIESVFQNGTEQGLSSIWSKVLGSALNASNLPQVDLSKVFDFENIRTNDPSAYSRFSTLLTAAKNATSDQDAFNKTKELNQFIESYLTNMSNAEFSSLLVRQYTNQLVKNVGGNNLVSFIYAIKDMPNAYLVVSKDKISIQQYTNFTSFDNFKEFVKNTLYSVAQGNKDIFNLPQAVSQSQNDNVILAHMLNDADFVSYLKTKENPFSKDKSNYSDEDIAKIKQENASIIAGNKSKMQIQNFTSVSNLINNSLVSQNSYNFGVKDGVARIISGFNGSIPTYLGNSESAQDLIVKVLISK
ncbi:hypothetical protein DEH79_01000 [Mycoplasmopsis synoviae]|uniref:HinT-interacting membrane complex protein P80 n=1 Tax=Mycoplasmopsis synoviae TaxID=2109 RepID=UPI000D211798|nr:hypothetical protein [Mycoplasmopsis synoviae]AQU48452.1 p80-related protein [Mycoplasmopsis synoviae]QLE13746.1 hypothetical protein DEH79_01000 [Mycoplasmopsis synoviae]